MFGSRWRRMPVSLLVPVAAVGIAGLTIAGCDSSGGTQSAGMAAQTWPFNSAQLRSALLARVNGFPAVAPAQSGRYATLPEAQTAGQAARGLIAAPKACGQITLDGLNAAALAGAPAATVSFRVHQNGVSEVLAAPPVAAASHAFAGWIPGACRQFRETVDGKTFRYKVGEIVLKGVGERARLINVKTTGFATNDVWTIVYLGDKFVGEVTVTGPDTSERATRELAKRAYAYAVTTLS